MNTQHKLLIYAIGIIAAAVFTWPAGLIVLFGAADLNGDLSPKK